MTPNSVFQKIEAVQERLKAEIQCIATSDAVETPVIEALQELATSLEQLQAAAEGLRVQSEEMAAARQQAGGEFRHYQKLFESAPGGYLVTDSDGVIQEANPAAAALLGAEQASLIAKSLPTFVAAKDRPAFQARLTQWQSSDLQAPLRFSELEFKRRDEASFPADLIIGPVHDAEGRLANLCWLLSDVTERGRIEKELERQRTFLRQVIDMNPNLIFVKDSQGRYLLANQAMAAAYQTTPELMIGKTDADLGSLAEESAKYRQDDAQVMQTGTEKFIPEERWTVASGEVRYFQTTKRPLADDQGKNTRVIAVSVDITGRERAGEALNRRAAQLALINDIGNKIAAALNLDEVMSRAARLAQKSFGYHHVALFAVDYEQEELVMKAKAGDFADLFPSAHRIKLGQGMVGWAGSHDVRLLANNVRNEPRYVNFYPDLIPTRSELCVPIRVGQETVGVLDVQSPRINAFDENDVMVMETLAAQVAIAMENARLYEAVQRELAERKRAEDEIRELNKDLERRAIEQDALNKASQALTSTLNLETVLRLVLAEVRSLLGMEGATVLLYEPASHELVFAASDGAGSEKLSGARMPATAGIAGWIMREGQSALVGNVQHDARFYPGIDAITGLTTRSLLAVPMTFNGVVTGVLETINKVGGDLTVHDLEMLTAIASSAAIAIENARLFEEVRTTRELLRDLASHQQAAREEERTRMAREIHDEFGQALTALKMDSVWLAKRLSKSQPVLRQKVDSMLELIDGTIQMVRRIATELRPGLLDDLGLAAAIEWQAQDFAERTGIKSELCLSDANTIQDRDLTTAVFRIFQETLTNVIRHAEATQIWVELDDQPNELVLIVQDNGKGITKSQISDPTSLGLIGMRERARFWGGDVEFRGAPEQGTTVTVRIPRPGAEESRHD
jgi:PAS domain S-box-containing protein